MWAIWLRAKLLSVWNNFQNVRIIWMLEIEAVKAFNWWASKELIGTKEMNDYNELHAKKLALKTTCSWIVSGFVVENTSFGSLVDLNVVNWDRNVRSDWFYSPGRWPATSFEAIKVARMQNGLDRPAIVIRIRSQWCFHWGLFYWNQMAPRMNRYYSTRCDSWPHPIA